MPLYAIDCEMVGSMNRSVLAKVSIVNEDGAIVLDEFVRPIAVISDYRTPIHGIRQEHLQNALDFYTVQMRVKRIINGAILIGHSLHFDLQVLGLTHPEQNLRDLANFKPFREMNNGQPASLQFLAKRILGRAIQQHLHDSVEDAKAAMDIYKKCAHIW